MIDKVYHISPHKGDIPWDITLTAQIAMVEEKMSGIATPARQQAVTPTVILVSTAKGPERYG
jgi:hypothetical protein